MFKKIVVHTRRSFKFIILFFIAALLIAGTINILYAPTYSVSLNGEHIGYTKNKTYLQEKINEYIEKGNEDNDNIAFVQIANLPEYTQCLLKKDITLNDDEILDKIKSSGITYYRYYSIADNNDEKLYVSKFDEAENIVNNLKEKDSNNVDSLSIVEKYETELKSFTSSEEAVSQLYIEKAKPVIIAKTSSGKVKASGSVNTNLTTSSGKANLGFSLIRPVSGTISSRFGVGSAIRRSSHTGLDIATSTGTPIAAAASGVVTFSGYKGSYGNMIVISHANNVQTYYGHCSKLYASVGESVSQGETIAAVGSTGNSTGPHLHLEVRVNGIAYDPQNYVY